MTSVGRWPSAPGGPPPGGPAGPPARIGSYRIERLLGVGSFATVWLGHDAVLGARVAIKVLAENWSYDLRVRERFSDEARMLWRLDHERIVRVYAVGELADGRPYLVMAWADGGSLRDRLSAGPLPVGTSLRVLGEIAAGVAVLHAHGIVHRDLTPGNVLFRTGAGSSVEQVLLADLGLAKALAAASGLTARAGTPGFMAPEQDHPLAVVDCRADVFGLGRLGGALLGVPGGQGDGAPRLRPGVPPGVADVLRRATAHRPADRYPDAAAFAAALQKATTGTRRRRSASPARRWTTTAVGSLVAAALVLATATDAAPTAAARGPAAGTDASGRITVALPDGWRATGAGWAGQHGSDGRLDPALVMSPDPGRWPIDAGVPGAFVGLRRGETETPAGFVAARGHPRCVAAPVRTARHGEIDWTIAEFGDCADGKPILVEAAGVGPGAAGLVYVQVAPPADADAGFLATLLAGVRTR